MKKTLVLIALLTFTLWSASYAVIGIGVRGGFGSFGSSAQGSSSQSALLFGAHVDFTALPLIGVEVSGTYWSKSQSTTAGTYTAKATSTIIPIEATGKYKFSIPASPITPYLGAGAGLYLASSKLTTTPANPLIPDTTISSNKFGIHFAAGASLKLPTMPISFGVQGKYALIFSDPGSHMLSIVGLMTYNF